MRKSRSITEAACRRAGAGLAGALLFLAAGCDLDRVSDAEALRLADPARRHPVAVEAHRASVDLPTSGAKSGSAWLEATRFVRQYRRDARGPLTIAYNRRDGVQRRLADGVRHIAADNGVPARAIRLVERHDGIDAVTLAYDAIVARGPECGDWSEDIGRRPALGPMPNFGCASRRNLAHMVAEPTDLLFPQLETQRTSERRAHAWRDYTGQKEGGSSGGGAGGGSAPAGSAPAKP